MDFLNQTSDQIKELYATMSVGGRITAAMLFAVVLLSVAYLFQYRSSSLDEFLLGGRVFSSSEIQGMEGAFATAGLSSYDYEIVGNRVKVSRSARIEFLAALADADAMPPGLDTFMDNAVGKISPFESNAQREARTKHAHEKRMSQIISRMHGVETAIVTYDEQDSGGFPRRKEKRALAAVWAEGNTHLSEQLVRTVRNTVSAAEAGLKPEHVTVIDENAGLSHVGLDSNGMPIAANDAYAMRKRMYEDRYRQKILSSLSYIPGVIVAVNVELNSEGVVQRSSTKYDSTETVAIRARDSSTTKTSSQPAPAGRPGAVANGVSANSSATVNQVAGAESTTEQSESDKTTVPSYEQIMARPADLVPREVKTSIAIPKSYALAVWREQNPAGADGEPAPEPTPDDLQKIETDNRTKIQEAIVAVLPELPAGDDKYQNVTVSSYQDIKTEPLQPPGFAANFMAWLGGNVKTVGLSLMGVVGLLMLRNMVRSAAAGSPDAEEASEESEQSIQLAEQTTTEEGEEPADPERASRLKTNFSGGPDLRGELADIVKEDPEAAANVLRGWIGDVG